MSNQDYHSVENDHNVWASEQSLSTNPFRHQASTTDYGEQQQQQQFPNAAAYNPGSQYQAQQGYAAPPGPPPQRRDSFDESKFVPESERAQQREAMEQFEMDRENAVAATGTNRAEDKRDQDVATLQREFPNIDGATIAAIYSDSGETGATREVLQELSQGS